MTDSTDTLLSSTRKPARRTSRTIGTRGYVGVAVEGSSRGFVGTQQSPYKGKGIHGVLSTVIKVARGKTALVRFHVSGSDRTSRDRCEHRSCADKTATMFRFEAAALSPAGKECLHDVLTKVSWKRTNGQVHERLAVRDVPGLRDDP